MPQTADLPTLHPIPEDISDQLRRLLLTPNDPALKTWLLELIKNSGHLSNTDDLRWRLLCVIWLAQFDVDEAWPYLMWLNMNEPVMQDHLNEILAEAVNDFDCHVLLANWVASAQDQRLISFFSEFRNVPALPKLPALFNQLLARPTAPEAEVWMAAFCRDTAQDTPPHLRRWHLLAAVWYATCFDPTTGLTYLQAISNGAETLSSTDNELLTNTASEINGVTAMIQWIAACPDPAVKTMLKEFGHPDLMAFTETTLQHSPNYDHLVDAAGQAPIDAQTFKRNVTILEKVGLELNTVKILDLACGPLAPQTLLFNSAGYSTTGVDLQIPPAYLPLPGLKFWLKRSRHSKAWQSATAAYYQALAQQARLKLTWKRVKIELADLTRLQFPDNSFQVVLCNNYLQHAPDVDSLLAEAARVLQSDGLLLADIRPYPALTGAFQTLESTPAWDHLRHNFYDPSLPLNQWRESQYRATFETYFSIEQWLTEQDEEAVTQLTPEIRAEFANFSAEELTRQEVIVLARKK
jgi:SAM-dependent methyltransferase